MNVAAVVLSGLVVALLLPASPAIPIDCMQLCRLEQHRHTFLLCPCPALLDLALRRARVHPTRMSHRTTTDLCDYLCSIQLGGEACHCTKPGLPGRK